MTDAADHAIEQLGSSSITEIIILGRREPAQAAYTNPEQRELGALGDADVVVDGAALPLDEHSRRYLGSDAADATERRNVEIISEFAARAPRGASKQLSLRFLCPRLKSSATTGAARSATIVVA